MHSVCLLAMKFMSAAIYPRHALHTYKPMGSVKQLYVQALQTALLLRTEFCACVEHTLLEGLGEYILFS